jgi:hypothetical protein
MSIPEIGAGGGGGAGLGAGARLHPAMTPTLAATERNNKLLIADPRSVADAAAGTVPMRAIN